MLIDRTRGAFATSDFPSRCLQGATAVARFHPGMNGRSVFGQERGINENYLFFFLAKGRRDVPGRMYSDWKHDVFRQCSRMISSFFFFFGVKIVLITLSIEREIATYVCIYTVVISTQFFF